MHIRFDTTKSILAFDPDPRFGGAFFAGQELSQRIRSARFKWLELKYGASFENVGRNDPCSGRKFKRCHIAEVP
jgi:hypothetical protein